MNNDKLLKLNVKVLLGPFLVMLISSIIEPITNSLVITFVVMELLYVICGVVIKQTNKISCMTNIESFKSSIRLETRILICLLLISLMIFTAFIILSLLLFAHLDTHNSNITEVNDKNIVEILVMNTIFAGICEEIAFRYCLFRELAKSSILLGMVSSSIIFAVCHAGVFSPFVFLGGLVFAVIYMLIGNIFINIIFHATYNFVLISCQYYYDQFNNLIPFYLCGIVSLILMIIAYTYIFFNKSMKGEIRLICKEVCNKEQIKLLKWVYKQPPMIMIFIVFTILILFMSILNIKFMTN